MTDQITITYAASQRAIAEAMTAAFLSIMGRRRWALQIAGIVVIILVSAGAGTALITLFLLATDDPGAGLPLVWVAAISAGVFYIWLQNWPVRAVAKHTALAPFSVGEQTAIFDTDGMLLRNPYAEWRSGWAAIDQISKGKRGLNLHVAGIAFSVPLASIDDPDTVIAQLRDWKTRA